MSIKMLSSAYFASVYTCAKAESTNIVRSRNFLIIMLAMAILAMLFFPNAEANYQTISIGNYRGIYNSAWIGNTLAMLNVSFLPFICFYYIRGSIQADKTSKRSELIAATSVDKTQIVLAKWLSNVFVMVCFLIWMIIVAIVMQLWLQENFNLNLFDIALPQILHVLPILLILAGITLVFDTIKFTSSSVGNVLYFFLCSFALVALVNYLSGIDQIIEQMIEQVSAISGSLIEGITIGISGIQEGQLLKRFDWQGTNYSLISFLPMLHAIVFAGALLMLAILFFDRYKTPVNSHSTASKNRLVRLGNAYIKVIDNALTKLCGPFVFLNIIYQETKLLFTDKGYWWGLALCVLWILQWLLPLTYMVEILLPASFLIAGLMLASLGQREEEYNVRELLCNSSVLMTKQFPAMLIAGSALIFLATSGAVFRLLLNGDWTIVLTMVCGILLISALAICFGSVFKTARVYEILYTLFWYMGPMSRFEYFDFIGISSYQSGEIPQLMLIVFSLCTLTLLIAAYYFRKKQFT